MTIDEALATIDRWYANKELLGVTVSTKDGSIKIKFPTPEAKRYQKPLQQLAIKINNEIVPWLITETIESQRWFIDYQPLIDDIAKQKDLVVSASLNFSGQEFFDFIYHFIDIHRQFYTLHAAEYNGSAWMCGDKELDRFALDCYKLPSKTETTSDADENAA